MDSVWTSRKKQGGISFLLLLALLAVISLNFILSASCRVSPPALTPLPSQIDRIEGYGSIKITDSEGSAKSKFSFLFVLPSQGRIDVFDLLGRAIYFILIEDNEAFLVIPSKKVYWQGKEAEIISRFLGFEIALPEMVSLLTGKWENKEEWALDKDSQGKVIAGQKEELQFQIKKFFSNTSVARLLTFEHPLSTAGMNILRIKFNPPAKQRLFSNNFLKDYELKSWPEIEALFKNEK
jgi:hypothetical protein